MFIKKECPFPIFCYKNISFEEKIGRGANSQVYRAIIDDKVYAIKEYNIGDWYDVQECYDNILYELNLSKDLINTNYTVKTFGVCIYNEFIYIIMEYLGNGKDLYDYLQQRYFWKACYQYNNVIVPKPENHYVIYNEDHGIHWCFTMNDNLKREISISLIEAVKELHENKIVHADLKTNNLIYHKNKIKLIDLGVSSKMDDELIKIERTYGTEGYMAPEQYKGFLSYKSDIYSVGVCLIEIWCGDIWENAGGFKPCRNEVLKCLRKIKKHDEKLSLLIRKSLSLDGAKRPSAGKLLTMIKNIS